ncbi:MAG: hypothetical protein LW884_05070 [Bacteroidetes bacterium]|nr:hypothetical protein [Bacteroidota bacterium]
MELGHRDIQLLYGPRLWRLHALPGQVAATAAPEATTPTPPAAEYAPEPSALPPAESPPAPAAWAQPADTRISLVLPTQPLAPAERQLLIDLLAALGLAPRQAVLKQDLPTEMSLAAAPTEIVLIFGHPTAPPVPHKQCIALPGLQQMLAQIDQKKLAWQLLKPLKDRL